MRTNNNTKPEKERSWETVVMRYNHPELRKGIWQILNSVVPYIFMWYIMYRSLEYSYIITLLLSIVASGFLIRIFIIFHDCGHGAFFSSRKANEVVGMIMGILALTPYYKWHQQHKIHHATAGNLDKRGVGDVWTMTVDEYRNSPKWTRFFYRAFRNPFFMFTVGPLLVVFYQNRVSNKYNTLKEKLNIYLTNGFILLMALSISMLIGFRAYLLIQIPLILVAHSIGIWLFYIQHQFDETSWVRDASWDYKTAAIKNCSYLKLPAVLQWFTGNIGFHHVHHLSPRIPNYNLEKCHFENEIFRDVKPVYLFKTFRALKLSLWDEAAHTMISFRSFFSPQKEVKSSL
jgi:acyl-lipid omega-6 desaturase (Delta-12 desaturase)